MLMELEKEFRVEQSPSGDTVLVHNRKAMTILLRGQMVKRLEHLARARDISVTRLLEEVVEQRFGASPTPGPPSA